MVSGRDGGGRAGRVARQERRLLGELTLLAVTSIGAGVALRRVTRRSADGAGPRPGAGRGGLVAGVARQAVAWGLVDLAIAGWGVRGLLRARRAGGPGEAAGTDDAAVARARRLGRVVGANAVLDVGYVAAGVALAVRRPARLGDGAGIAVQGLALLWLDVRHARAFRGLSSPVPRRGDGGPT